MRPLCQVTGIGPPLRIALLAFAMMCNLPHAAVGFAFTPGHLYATLSDTPNIIEYSETGTVLGSLTVPSLIPGDELRGIVFGPDGFLYAVKVHPDTIPGFSVLVLDSSGTLHNTYTYTNTIFDTLSYGKIALDQQYIYVAGSYYLFRFTLGDPTSGVPIYNNNQVFDVKTLPNGHLFVAWAYGVDEITNTGTLVRSIPLIGAYWGDVRGIEYDAAINKLFATELGYSFFDFPLMRIDASTGVLENYVSFWYGDDLFLTRSSTLLVGSQAEAPAIYNENLTWIAPLGTTTRSFVTQYPALGPAPTPTPSPCVPQYIITQIGGPIIPGTTDTGNHCLNCTTAVTLPFPFILYDAAYTSVNVSNNGNAQFIGTNTEYLNPCLPAAPSISPWNYTIFPYWEEQMTAGNLACSPAPCGIFTSVSGTAPNRIFNIEWRTWYYPQGGSANYELRLYEGQTRFDVIYGSVTNGNISATAGVQKDHLAFTQYFCNGSGGAATGGQSYTLTPCGSLSPTPTPTATPSPTPTATETPLPTPTATGTPTPTPCVPQYTITQIGGIIVPGTTDTGNHCIDCTTAVTLPFPFTLYDTAYTSVNVSNNGHAQFTGANTLYYNFCLPVSPWNNTIFPYWDDQMTNNGLTCSPGPCGIFTSVSGTAPNRIFNIEWRTQYYPGTGNANYELRLYEGQARFDVIYGNSTNGNNSATAGVQGSGTFTQYFCNGSGGAAAGGQSYTLTPCGSPSPTATPTPISARSPMPRPSRTPLPRPSPSSTPTATETPSPTPTATGTPSPTPTPRMTPTPRSRSTPRA